MRLYRLLFCAVLLAGTCVTLESASARVKLITLPVRQRVEIQLDHPQATLVEEERIVPLVKGVNQVDFSWANTQIDPNTIVFRVIGAGDACRRWHGRGRGRRPSWTSRCSRSAIRPTKRPWSGRSPPATPVRPACGSATCWAT